MNFSIKDDNNKNECSFGYDDHSDTLTITADGFYKTVDLNINPKKVSDLIDYLQEYLYTTGGP